MLVCCLPRHTRIHGIIDGDVALPRCAHAPVSRESVVVAPAQSAFIIQIDTCAKWLTTAARPCGPRFGWSWECATVLYG